MCKRTGMSWHGARKGTSPPATFDKCGTSVILEVFASPRAHKLRPAYFQLYTSLCRKNTDQSFNSKTSIDSTSGVATTTCVHFPYDLNRTHATKARPHHALAGSMIAPVSHSYHDSSDHLFRQQPSPLRCSTRTSAGPRRPSGGARTATRRRHPRRGARPRRRGPRASR
jgi:hypothetical protein